MQERFLGFLPTRAQLDRSAMVLALAGFDRLKQLVISSSHRPHTYEVMGWPKQVRSKAAKLNPSAAARRHKGTLHQENVVWQLGARVSPKPLIGQLRANHHLGDLKAGILTARGPEVNMVGKTQTRQPARDGSGQDRREAHPRSPELGRVTITNETQSIKGRVPKQQVLGRILNDAEDDVLLDRSVWAFLEAKPNRSDLPDVDLNPTC
jgi:hypothetical protein